MRAQKDTFRGRLGGRIARTIGALAIASGIVVTGAATGASADGPSLPLHNTSPGSTATTGSGICAINGLDSSTSYWHFVITKNPFALQNITLNVGGTSYPNVSYVTNGKIDQAYVAVPAGKSLGDLQQSGSFANVTPDPTDSPVQFVLSHTCSAVETPPPPVDVCDNLQGDQAEVPEGYTSDGEGTCTETPPPVDVCDNLQGDQAEVPEGYTSDGEGTCTETPPPVDVCNNIDDNQSEIPAGLISDGDGGCITPPVDVCNNIDDNQSEIPAGLISDGDGGCITPPPPPVDVCNNIAGNQASIPADLISDGNGGCVAPPPPVVDLCTNIDGVQTSVPSGFSVDGTTCTAPPVDVCNNIDGNQSSIPAGMVSDGKGGCVTSQVASDAPTPSVIDVCANIAGDQLEVPSGYTLNNGNCEIVASEAVSPPADVTLPVTGANTTSGIIIGLGMVAAGVALSVLARRRTARTNS